MTEPAYEDLFHPPNEFEQFAEARRLDSNGLLWQVPGLSLTAQSFLIAAALGQDAAEGLRIGTAVLAAILAVATLQLLSRHRYRTQLFSNGIDASRAQRGVPPLDDPDLFEVIAARRPTGDAGPGDTAAQRFRDYRQRRRLKHVMAFRTWTLVLSAFVVLDVAIVLVIALG